jgi:ABC-type branched-subunit amino acid transport system ATPase component
MTTCVLETRGLTKAFGGLTAVDDVSFALHKGELLALIGPNGAGKSTCFNMLMGQLPPTAARSFLDGEKITGLAPRQIWRKGVGRTFQITATYSSMTVVENVQMALMSHNGEIFRFLPYAHTATATRRWRCWTWWAWPTRPTGTAPCSPMATSSAWNWPLRWRMTQAAADGRAHRRHGPAERVALMELTARIVAERGVSVLFTEHDMDVVFGHAHRIMVLNRGRLIAEGLRRTEIRANPWCRRSIWAAAPSFGQEEAGAMLEVEGINSFYGKAHVLRAELQVPRGKVVALLGRNGAGKTTTMKSIIQLVRPRLGEITFDGRPILGLPPHRIAKMGWATCRRSAASSPT